MRNCPDHCGDYTVPVRDRGLDGQWRAHSRRRLLTCSIDMPPSSQKRLIVFVFRRV
jgi:hypothetical protein